MTGASVPLFDGVWVSDDGSRTDVELGADGTLMYMAGEGGTILRELVWVSRDGTPRAIDPNWPVAAFNDPALSPDGRQLAVTVWEDDEPEIWVKQLPQGRFSPFTSQGGSRPAWTADGQLAFWSTRGGDGNQVYQRRSDGSAPPELVPVLDATPNPGQVTFSEGGGWMVFESGNFLGNGGDIYAVPLDSSGAPEGDPIGLLTSEANEFQPTLSPDARWLAYVTNSGRGHSVRVCPFPGCEVPVVVSSDNATVPIWAHDGAELFYRSGGFLHVVEVLPGTTFEWGEARPLFDLTAFDGSWPHPFALTRDDERFVMVREAQRGDQSPQLIVVRNFSELLEERVPN